MRRLSILGMGLSVLALPLWALANNQTVTLMPGLYDFTHSTTINGQSQLVDDYEYCIAEGRNSKSLNEIVADIVEGGQCSASNVVMTSSTGRADVSCTDPDFGIRYNGRMEARYGADFYDVDTRASVNGMSINLMTKVKRRGVCPPGWDNPDDVSPD